MIRRDELRAYLHEALSCANFNDYAPNGLQIEGADKLHRICTAVTASLDVIEQALSLKAEALLVHHGYFWRGEEAIITGMRRTRIAKFLKGNLNLFAYHLPLDCHPQWGNNAAIAKILNLQDVKKYEASKVADLLWVGSLRKTKTAAEFAKELTKKLAREPIFIAGSEKPIRCLAWCSGAAQDFIEQAYQLGADAYLSGEISERTYYQARELGIHYFACGHHATERFGIQALGEHLVERFGVEHYFIDSENPV